MVYQLYYEFLRALLLTLIVEGVAVFAIFRRTEYVYYSALCNLLTNPALNLLLAASVSFFGLDAYYPTLAAAELAVVIVEAVVYDYICGIGMKKAALLSAVLNALSLAAGMLVTVQK